MLISLPTGAKSDSRTFSVAIVQGDSQYLDKNFSVTWLGHLGGRLPQLVEAIESGPPLLDLSYRHGECRIW